MTTTTEHVDAPKTPPTVPLAAPTNGSQTVQAPQAAQPLEALQGEQRGLFEMAKMKRQLAIKEAEVALAKTEAAESEFRCILLRLYMTLGLDPEKDSINEQGIITRNAQKKGS
jgi:hypothetical protein